MTMNKIKIHTDPIVQTKFNSYPGNMRHKLNELRALIIDVAAQVEEIHEIEETLKWGEPSYLVKKGSTIRIDWKSKVPEQYAMYFSCSTSLVETFKYAYGDLFKYEKKRALLFHIDDEIPEVQLKDCIRMALQYHRIKHLPFLGK